MSNVTKLFEETMTDLVSFQQSFHTLTHLYENNDVVGFVIRKQFSPYLNDTCISSKNKYLEQSIKMFVKDALLKMTLDERSEFIEQQKKIWDWNESCE